MEKDGEDKWKARKAGWIVNQTPTLGPKHDKIWAQCILDIMSKNMLKGYDGANAPRWNFEIKPFAIQ
jgi:hypothetical protein